ncbi:hypothetical protein Btru_071315 [Bulinus truncatus]|nr:hypothetical protein Btru_071315 [Bulinus truncatus]
MSITVPLLIKGVLQKGVHQKGVHQKGVHQKGVHQKDMYSSKQCVVRTNKVAPVIIKDCREEFQQFLEISEPIVHGSLAEGMAEHPLIKGKYFIVQDFNDVRDSLQTYRHTCAPNFHQASSDQPIFASGQPTVNGLSKVLSQLNSDVHTFVKNILHSLEERTSLATNEISTYIRLTPSLHHTHITINEFHCDAICTPTNTVNMLLFCDDKIRFAPSINTLNAAHRIFGKGIKLIPTRVTTTALTLTLTPLYVPQDILLLNLRSEPVLFQRVDDDYVPYSVRHQENIHNMVMMGDTKDSCDHIESCIRKEIVSLASIEDEFVFYFYDSLEKLQHEPHIRKVEFEEDILLSAEVYAREAFSNRLLSYDRICLPEMGIPTEDLVDQFLAHFRESPGYLDKNNPAFPAIYLISHSGGRRSAIMMVMCCLLYAHKKGTLTKECSHMINPKHPNYNDGEYQAVQKLVSHLKDGNLIKKQVDSVIDECSQVINLRTCIIDHKKKLEAAAFKRMQVNITFDLLRTPMNRAGKHNFTLIMCTTEP